MNLTPGSVAVTILLALGACATPPVYQGRSVLPVAQREAATRDVRLMSGSTCREPGTLNMDIVDFNRNANGQVSRVRERWQLQACGQRFDYELSFDPEVATGSNYSISRLP